MSEKKEGEIIGDLDASTKSFYGEDLGTKNVSKTIPKRCPTDEKIDAKKGCFLTSTF